MKSSFIRCRTGALAAALATVISATPAIAQSAAWQPAATSSLAKTEAILGTQSRLASILAVQQGLPAPKPLQPASLSATTPTYAVLREARRFSAGATSGRPDVFGSVALSVGRTPLDRRWRAVARQRVVGAPASYAASLRGRDAMARVEAVNRYVNARVQFVDDSRQYRREDFWSAASDTLRRGRGDCEDYAIAKLQMLRAAGFSDRDLYLVVAKDLVRRSDHALLVVRAAGRMLVLDNGTDVILDADDASDYRPVLTFAANGAWTHGYRRRMPDLTIAAATIAPLTPSGPAAPAD
ncbi:MAG TPA: transglutaminase-like cysteine peptidase [Sphingomicrobium sp.]|nr:transglutaminase-like cysteine peptidase [Sphingomicrobium sp.]